MSEQPSIDPTLAAEHAADANVKCVEDFEAHARAYGLSHQEEVAAYQVLFDLKGQIGQLIDSYGVPAASAPRVMRQASYMVHRAAELAHALDELLGDDARRAWTQSWGVLCRREKGGGL